ADPVGLQNFLRFYDQGGTIEQIEAMLTGSSEYYRTRGGGTDDGFLDALFRDGLGRPIDLAGRTTFRQALAHGAPRGQVAAVIFASQEYRENLVRGYYQRFLHRAADARGLAGHVAALAGGVRDEQVLTRILGSEEYFGQL